MNRTAKITLSAFEMELVHNAEWIFAKQLIIEKVYALFGELHREYRSVLLQNGSTVLPAKGGKISKGEKYRGLPYVILDYPAAFSRDQIIAVRTLFWWGNFFSISLHVSGEYKKAMQNSAEAIRFLRENSFAICVNDDEWQHDFSETNYVEIEDMDDGKLKNVLEKPFLKISKKVPLAQWEQSAAILTDDFRKIVAYVKLSFPGGERAL